MIEIRHLKKVFNNKFRESVVLNDINLTVHDGEIFGIIGLSGAGKSTFVRCINFLERPTEGDVIIDGKNLTELSAKEILKLRQSIGMIFQNFNLLEQRNVIKNVCFPMEIAGIKKEQAEKRAMELLELVGLSNKAQSYPSRLSGGQKQRVAIARALAMEPKYLLCDEATSALDPNTTASILELLKKINKTLNVTIIVITHEMRVVDSICDFVAVIDNCRIAEQGRVSEVFVNPKSDIARELILPYGKEPLSISGKNCVKIIFEGGDCDKSVISDMIIKTSVPINMKFADVKNKDGKIYGEAMFELPDDKEKQNKILVWLNANGIKYIKE